MAKVIRNPILKSIVNILLVILGTIILAFGSGVFLIPFQIVSGGIAGIGVLLSNFLPVDITTYIISWSLFFIGLLILGLKFSLTTLISTIIYPLALTLILRTNIANSIIELMLPNQVHIELINGVINVEILKNTEVGIFLIAGIIGGACVGIGCSLTFLGGGSTGGLDILTFIINKYTGIKTSIVFFAIDATIVGTGLIVDIVGHESFRFIGGLVGIITAFISSLMIDTIYAGNQKGYNVDIITDKYNEIIEYSIKELDRSATIFECVGAYSKEGKKMVRIAFNRREYTKIKDGIAKIDPNAFSMFTQTCFIGGEGFNKIAISSENSISYLKKLIGKNKKDRKKNHDE